MKQGRKNFDWTEEKLMLLRTNYPIKHNGEVAEMLGASERTIVRKAKELELKKESIDERHRQMEETVRAKYATHSRTELADELHVSAWTIGRIAKKLGLIRTEGEEHAIRCKARQRVLKMVRYRNACDPTEKRATIKLLPNFTKEGAHRHKARINLRSKLKKLGYITEWDGENVYYTEGMKRHGTREKHGEALGLTFSLFRPTSMSQGMIMC